MLPSMLTAVCASSRPFDRRARPQRDRRLRQNDRGVDRHSAKQREVAERRVGDEDDVPATAAVTPVGTALRDVLLAPEGQRAIPAPAGADDDTEHGGRNAGHGGRTWPAWGPSSRPAGALTATERRSPLREYSTTPSRSAKSVSSRPIPTPRAGSESRAALPHDDHPRLDLLAGEDLHAETLALGVASVLRGAEALLCVPLLSLRDRGLERAAIAPLRFAWDCSYASAAASLRRPSLQLPASPRRR